MVKDFKIRNSIARFLFFVATWKEDGMQELYKDKTM